MDAQTVVVRADELIGAEVDDEIVILNLARDSYVGLDAIGRRIWELVEQQIRVDALCQQLRAEFAGAEDQIAEDVLSFLSELAEEGLLRVVNAAD